MLELLSDQVIRFRWWFYEMFVREFEIDNDINRPYPGQARALQLMNADR